MIPQIKEINLPSYATLSSATVNLADMADNTITAEVKIDGGIAPNFNYDWEVEFRGERYVHSLRKPQASKDNTTVNSVSSLTFKQKAVVELQRFYFFTYAATNSGTAVADQYIAPLTLNLKNFCIAFNEVLDYYFHGSITIDLNPDWVYDIEPKTMEISYSYLWDVLIQLYELYGVRWRIVTVGNKYVIKVGYPTEELDHIFQYGFEGGLLKIERQVQDDNIRNILLGRGGEKNLPAYYFKDNTTDTTFPSDPDWIPELANIYFGNLRDINFRDYVKGWKANPRRDLMGGKLELEAYDANYAADHFAYELGATDEFFRPVEYVKDDDSIAQYGELWGALDNNEDIYPTIQGVTIGPIGRVDEVIAVQPIESDDVEDAVESEAQLSDLPEESTTVYAESAKRVQFTISCSQFVVPEGLHGTLEITPQVKRVYNRKSGKWLSGDKVAGLALVENYTIKVFDKNTNSEVFLTNIPSGTYRYTVSGTVVNNDSEALNITVGISNGKVVSSDKGQTWGNTFDIWIKNIWLTSKRPGETDQQYVNRVWTPILGGRDGEEAKVVFSTGWLSTSEDYEFTIVKDGVHFEQKECKWTDSEGVEHKYTSEWRLTLAKSDAEYDATGLYLPNTRINASAGDFFFFIGIELPHQYILWAEERLNAYKRDQLGEVADIRPTWSVDLDKIRIAREKIDPNEVVFLIEQIVPGASFKLADSRFITDKAYETVYVQSMTFDFKEPTENDPALIPDVSVVLSNQWANTASVVSTLQGSIDALAKQIGSLSNIEQLIRVIGDKLYLRKDGITDLSLSPTQFASLVTSLGFRQGILGGQGWGFFKDEQGNWSLEVDRLNVRQQMQVNELVINQISARGGMYVESAANMEITSVVNTTDGYVCYFDQKGGTISNLFKVGDVALCHRFTAENGELKFYKRRVMAVGVDHVVLSESIKNGDGVPAEGDVIVQYGSYTDPARRYVKVRDVIGGGYERYIENLDSVNATGTEYYFVGRQSGSYGNNPRFFIGNNQNFVEFVNGELNIKAKINTLSTFGDKTLEEALQGAEFSPNLIAGANKVLDSTSYGLGAYKWDARPEAGTKCSITICGKVGATDEAVGVYQNGGYNPIGHFYSKTEAVQTFEFEVIDNPNTPSTSIAFYHSPNDGNFDSGSYIKWAVVTVGSGAASAWVPSASEMTAQNLMSRYSADASAWHTNYQSGDVWMQTSNDGGQTWSAAVRIQGASYAPNLLLNKYGSKSSNVAYIDNGAEITYVNQDTYFGVYTDGTLEVKAGDVFTLSCDVEGVDVPGWTFYILGEQGSKLTLANGRCHATITATKAQSVTSITVDDYTRQSQNSKIRLTNIKLERGVNSTPEWTPAASEMVGTDGAPGKDGSYPVFNWAKNTDPTTAPTNGWQSAPPTNVAAGEYVWMHQGTITPPSTTPVWSAPVRLTGDTGASGSDVYMLDLSNEVAAVACNATGTPTSALPTSSITVYKGGSVDSGWSFSLSVNGGTASISGSTLSINTLTADNATVTVTATKSGAPTLTTTMSVYKVRPGQNGQPGASYAPNLFKNTKAGFTNWASDHPTASTITTALDAEGFRVMTQTLTVANANHNTYTWLDNFCDNGLTGTLVKGRIYTMSFEYKSVDEINAQVGYRYNDAWGYYPPHANTYPASSEWKRVSFPFTCDFVGSAIQRLYMQVHIKHGIGAVGDTASFRKFCLVEGTSAEWTPAASEMVGTDGQDAVVYQLELSANNISRDALGNLSASSITVQKYKTTGASTRTLTTEKTVRYQRIGLDSSTTTLSAATSSYTIPLPTTEPNRSKVTAIIVELLDGTTVLDRERIPVIEEGSRLGDNLVKDSEYNISRSEYSFVKVITTEKLVIGDTYTITIWGQLGSGRSWYFYDNYGGVYMGTVAKIGTYDGGEIYSTTFTLPSTMADRARDIFTIYNGPSSATSSSTIHRVKIEKGINRAPVWTASPYDMDYIKSALKESGSIEGGLVLASLMRLGYTNRNGEYVTMAGMNGIYNGNDKGGGLMLWGGGDMIDPDGTRSGTSATSGIRMDGTAFFCNNVIRLEKNRIMVGDVVQLASDGLTLIDGSNNALRIGDVSVPELMTAASSSGQLSQTSFSSGQIMVYKDGNLFVAANTSINKTALNGNTVLPAGAVVTLSGTIEVPQMEGVPLNEFGATVVVDFYLDNTMLQTSHLNLQAGSGKWSTPFSTTLHLPHSGKLYGVLRFDYPIASGAQLVEGSPFTGATFYMTTRSWQYTTSNQNTLGKNGFLAAWGQSLLYCGADGVEMRFNNTRLRLDSNGIRKSTNNGSSWSPL